MTNVTSLHGGPVPDGQPNETCIRILEDWLEKARSGEIIGVTAAALHGDGGASWICGGRVGGYSVLGALRVADTNLSNMLLDGDIGEGE